MEKDTEFDALLKKLNDLNWPQVYMFKFIILATNQKIALVESKFSEAAVISHKSSANGKYISITVREVMLSPESVIEKYRAMKDIEGLMAL
jgi:hypothetical protein